MFSSCKCVQVLSMQIKSVIIILRVVAFYCLFVLCVLEADAVIVIHSYCWWNWLFLLIHQHNLLSSMQDHLS